MCVYVYKPDIVLVGLMAPVLRAGIAKQAAGSTPSLIRALNAMLAKLPSSCFERSPKGISYTLNQRIACYFVKVEAEQTTDQLSLYFLFSCIIIKGLDRLLISKFPLFLFFFPLRARARMLPAGIAIRPRRPCMRICRPRNCQFPD